MATKVNLPEESLYVLETEELKCDRYSLWKAHVKKTSKKVSAKVYNRKFVDIPANREKLNFELECFKTSVCPFIGRFIDFFETSEYSIIILEGSLGTQLSSIISDSNKMGESVSRKIFSQLLVFVDYINKILSVVHGSLCPDIIMMTEDSVIKVIDFWGAFNHETEVKSFQSFSTADYIPPEVLAGKIPTSASDIWCVSVISYCLMCGENPFDKNKRTEQHVHIACRVNFPAFLSRRIIDLLRKTLCANPNQRIAIDEIENHTWFSGSQTFQLLKQFNNNKIVFDSDAAELVKEYSPEENLIVDIAEFNKTGKITEDLSIYLEAEAELMNDEIISLLEKSSAVISKSRPNSPRTSSPAVGSPRTPKSTNSTHLGLSFSKVFGSQPMMLDRMPSSEKFKLKPLVVSQARPVQIAARRASNAIAQPFTKTNYN